MGKHTKKRAARKPGAQPESLRCLTRGQLPIRKQTRRVKRNACDRTGQSQGEVKEGINISHSEEPLIAPPELRRQHRAEEKGGRGNYLLRIKGGTDGGPQSTDRQRKSGDDDDRKPPGSIQRTRHLGENAK